APALEREQGAGAPDRDGSGDETATVAEKEEGAAPGKAPLWQETGIPGKMLTADIPVFEAEICDPATLDEKLIFDLGESIGVAVALRSERDLSPCTLACLLFDSLGNVVAVPYAALDKLPKGEHKLAFTIENPNLRTGEYTVSLELYEDFDPCWNKTHRMPFLAYWYRGLSLKIDERRSGTINLGLVKIDASLARLP
ncbi:MAG: hypothetical protein FWH34_00880, partial [Desulfovibrionaceae bacterium]|nr:hypothetical protein [Desulfovibrionaceae bacterium]